MKDPELIHAAWSLTELLTNIKLSSDITEVTVKY